MAPPSRGVCAAKNTLVSLLSFSPELANLMGRQVATSFPGMSPDSAHSGSRCGLGWGPVEVGTRRWPRRPRGRRGRTPAPLCPSLAFLGRFPQAAWPREVRAAQTKEPPPRPLGLGWAVSPADSRFTTPTSVSLRRERGKKDPSHSWQDSRCPELQVGRGGGSVLQFVSLKPTAEERPTRLSFPPGLHSSHTMGHTVGRAFQMQPDTQAGTLRPRGWGPGGLGRPPRPQRPSGAAAGLAELGAPAAGYVGAEANNFMKTLTLR